MNLMNTATNNTPSRTEILALRAEAYEAGDFHLAGICELALNRHASAHDAAMKADLRGRTDIFGLLDLRYEAATEIARGRVAEVLLTAKAVSL